MQTIFKLGVYVICHEPNMWCELLAKREKVAKRGAATIVDGPVGWQSEQVGRNRGHTRGEQFAHSKIAENAGKMICPRYPLLPQSYAIIFFRWRFFVFFA